MKCIKLFLLFILLVAFFSSCQQKKLPVNVIHKLSPENSVQIKEWAVAGPFYRDIGDSLAINSKDYDELKRFGTSETDLNSHKYISIKHSSALNLTQSLVNISYHIPLDYFHLPWINEEYATMDVGSVYLACYINSPAEQQVILMMGSQGNMKVWQNDSLVYNKDWFRLKKYTGFVPVKLSKGNNKFLVKLTKISAFEGVNQQIRMVFDLGTKRYAKQFHYNKFRENFLEYSVLENQKALSFKNSLFANSSCSIQITDVSGSIIFQDDFTFKGMYHKTLNDLANGIYRVQVKFEDYTYVQDFFTGNLEKRRTVLIDNADKLLSKQPDYKNEIKAHLDRLRISCRNKIDSRIRIYKFEVLTSNDKKNWNLQYVSTSNAYTLQNGMIPFNNTKCRYIKIGCHGSSENHANNITELAVFQSIGSGQSHLPVTASDVSNNEQDSYKMMDQSYNTSWIAKGKEEWVMLDLGSSKQVSAISIAWKRSIISHHLYQRWERTAVFSFTIAERFFSALSRGENPFLEKGTHLRSYTSKIDTNVQHYIFHTPAEARHKGKLPLLVYFPIDVNYRAPYQHSLAIKNRDLAERLNLASENHGFAYLLVNGRMYQKDKVSPTHEIAFFEELNEVFRNYPIDTSRVYLTGICGGARRAIHIAAKYPGEFSGLGLIAAVFPDILSARHQNYTGYMKNLSNLPVFMAHSRYDTHSPFPPAEKFYEDLKSINGKTKMIVSEYGLGRFYNLEYFDEMFRFFNHLGNR